MDKKQETGMMGLADFWLWPFGMWKAATDSWLHYMTGFLGADGKPVLPGNPAAGLPVDPWAVLRIWMPQVDAVVEPVTDESGDEAVRVRMRVQVPGLGKPEALAIDAVVARESTPVESGGLVIDATPAPKKVAAPRKAPVKRSAPKAVAPAVAAPAAEGGAEVKPARKPAARRTKAPPAENS